MFNFIKRKKQIEDKKTNDIKDYSHIKNPDEKFIFEEFCNKDNLIVKSGCIISPSGFVLATYPFGSCYYKNINEESKLMKILFLLIQIRIIRQNTEICLI